MDSCAIKDIVEYYRARAPEYENRDISLRNADVAELRKLFGPLVSGQNLLEIACGTGIWTEYAAAFARSVTATDINLPMLKLAERRLRNNANVTFLEANAFDLKLSRTDFSAGFAGWWISHVDKSKLRSFLEGFHRTLGPGSTVIFMDDTEALLEKVSYIDGNQNSYVTRSLKDGRKYEIIKNIFTEDMLRQLFREIEIDVEIHMLDYHWLLTYSLPDQTLPD